MDTKFLTLTGALSVLTFGGVWLATPASRAGSATKGVTSVYYSGCTAARAAGVAPLLVGQPGYRAGMDGDGDGVACEPYWGDRDGGARPRRRR